MKTTCNFNRAAAGLAAIAAFAFPLGGASAATDDGAADCVRPGPCEDGGRSAVPESPETPPEGEGAALDGAGNASAGSAQGGEASRALADDGRRAHPDQPPRPSGERSPVEAVPLARTGADTWVVLLGGLGSILTGAGLLAIVRWPARSR